MRRKVKKEANYYVKQVSKLRLALKSEAQKLSQLVQDTDALRQREQVLQLCIAQTMTGVVAMKELMLPGGGTESQQLDALRLITALRQTWHGQQGRMSAATTVPCSAQTVQPACGTFASMSMQNLSGRQPATAPSLRLHQQQQQQQQQQCDPHTPGSLEQQTSTQDDCSVSYILAELELHIQAALHQGKCQEVSGSELYTTTIINRLMQDRRRLEKLSAMSTQQLLASRRGAVKQFGFLLPRYDSNHLTTSGSFAKQQVDLLVDHQVEITLARGLAGQLMFKLDPLMVDMDTGYQQEVPGGWWKQVVKALELAEQQQASFRCLWTFTSSTVQQLVTGYQQLSMRLLQLLQQQLETQRQFDINCRAVFKDNIQQPPSLAGYPQQVAAEQPKQLVDVQQCTDLPLHSLRENPLLKMLFPEEVLAAAMRDTVAADGGTSNVATAAAVNAAAGATTQPAGRVTAAAYGLPLAQMHLNTAALATGNAEQPESVEMQYSTLQAGCCPTQQAVHMQHLGRQSSLQQKAPSRLNVAAATPVTAPTAAIAAAAVEEQPPASTMSSISDSLPTPLRLLVLNPDLSYEPWSSEQQDLQEQMIQVMHKLSVVLFMHEMQMMNVLSRKQLALAAVHSYPYCLDAFSVCLALHELDKGKGDTLEDEQPRRADEHDQTLSEEQ